jgi:signal transduction histidine kinase
MPKSSPLRWPAPAAMLGYGVAVLSAALAVIAGDPVVASTGTSPRQLLLLAVALSAWLGGFGPALLAAILSAAADAYHFEPPIDAFAVKLEHVPRFLIFVVSALIVSALGAWRGGATVTVALGIDGEPPARVVGSSYVRPITAAAFAIGIFLLDTLTPLEIAVGVLYVAVVLMAINLYRARGVLLVCFGCMALTMLSYALKQGEGSHAIGLLNCALSLAAIGVTTLLGLKNQSAMASLRRARDELGGKVRELRRTNTMLQTEIIERERAEEALQEARATLAHTARVATLGELTASIAHEVNQPLVGVVTSGNAGLRWLAADPPNVEAARRAVERVVRDGHRASEVIERTRALIKKTPPKKERVDLNEIVSETIALTRAEAQRNGVALQTDLAHELPLVAGDRIQLQQVILNLIVNAIEAMSGDDAGQRELLVVSGKDGPNRVVIAVRDSGPGPEQEGLNRLFDAFYTTKPHGMGMGLAISRTIIESHGGRLSATPNLPRGAVFQFDLPIDGDEASSPNHPRSPSVIMP